MPPVYSRAYAWFKSRRTLAVSLDFSVIFSKFVELRGMIKMMIRQTIEDEHAPVRDFVSSNRGDKTPVELFCGFCSEIEDARRLMQMRL
jgi:hypothetical protein